ncbi:hypothetical protein G9A89_005902 [Geosiphon pyriformis]|nr:hypothetical protein G9A89_005902 [Geosiphon pyriformis]
MLLYIYVGSGSGFLPGDLHLDVDWPGFSRVWHLDSYMATDFTSRCTANICTYFIKALYHQLPMAVRKCVYDRCYPSVLCLYCGKVEVFDHVFSCVIDNSAHRQKMLFGLSLSSSSVLQLLLICALNFLEAVSVFYNPKVAGVKIADFVCSLCVAFRNNIWLVHAKYCAYMEKNGLIPVNDSIPISVSGLVLRFSDGVVKLLNIAKAFGVCFGFHKSCSFFSGIGDPRFLLI